MKNYHKCFVYEKRIQHAIWVQEKDKHVLQLFPALLLSAIV